jgi:hypothetical protein
MVKKIDIGYFIFQLLATSLATHGCSYSDTFHSLPWVNTGLIDMKCTVNGNLNQGHLMQVIVS